jgi:translation initiation factor IF-3
VTSIAREYRANGRIRASTVRVVSDDGEQLLGIMSLADALSLARGKELDLVEVAPAADPPVCKLLDYGRFKYVQTKKEREAKKAQKSTGLREVRFRPAIGQHDLDAKVRIVRKLLNIGAKVKLSVVFRGRSIAHPEIGVTLLRKVAEGLQEIAKLEKPPGMEGRTLSIILAPMSHRDARALPNVDKDNTMKTQDSVQTEKPQEGSAETAEEKEHAQA